MRFPYRKSIANCPLKNKQVGSLLQEKYAIFPILLWGKKISVPLYLMIRLSYLTVNQGL